MKRIISNSRDSYQTQSSGRLAVRAQRCRRTGLSSVMAALMLLLAGVLAFWPGTAQAATKDWSATAGSTLWNTAGNWGGGVVPVNDLLTDIARFNQTSYAFQPTASNDRNVNGITIGDGTTATAALTLTTGTGVNKLNIGTGGIVMNANSGAVTIGDGTTRGLDLGGNQSWANNSSSLLTVRAISNGGDANPYTLTLSGSGSGGITIENNITDGGAVGTVAIVNNYSGGVTTLSGANTFSGGVTLTLGTLNINSTTALGATAGTFTINGGNIDNSTAAGITMANNNPTTINGDFTFTGTSALNLGTGPVSLGTAAGTTRQLTVNDNALTIGGVISDGTTAKSLTIKGNDDLRLSGNNTYSGGTTIADGGVQPANNNAFGSGDVTISTGGGFNGSGTDVILPNRLILSATGGGNMLSSGATWINTWSGTGSYSFNGFRNGFLGLSGNNINWSGNMTFIGSAQLQLGHANALGTGILITGSDIASRQLASIKPTTDLSAGNGVANNITDNIAGLVFYLDNNLKLSGKITGPGSIRIGNDSTATLTLTGNNDYTGFNNIQAGTLSVDTIGNGGTTGPLGSGLNTAIYLNIGGAASGASGTLKYTGAGETSDRLFTIGSASATNGILSTPGVALDSTVISRIDASGSGPIVFGNTGRLNVGNAANTILELMGSNTGANTLAAVIGNSTDGDVKPTGPDSSILLTANGNANRQVTVADTTGIQVGDVVSGTGIPVGSVVTAVLGPTRIAISLGATVTSSTTVLTFTPASIAGNKTSLVKSGAGTWVLTGSNTYTGDTTVNGGTLLVNSWLAAGSAVTVNGGGTLGGTGTVNGSVSVSGTLDPGASVGTLKLKGNVTFNADSTNNVDISGANCDVIDLGGTATLTITSGAILKLGTLVSGNSYIIARNINGAVTGTFKDTAGKVLSNGVELPLQPGWHIYYVANGTASYILLNHEVAQYPLNNSFTGWPADNAWNALSALNDATTGANQLFDFVGDTSNLCGYWAQNLTYVFFRMRVQTNLVSATTYNGLGTLWVYIDTNNDNRADCSFAWDKRSNDDANHGLECQKFKSCNAGTWDDLQMQDVDNNEGTKGTADINGNSRTGDGYVRSVDGQATTNFGTTAFIDFAVSWAYLRNYSTTGLNTGQTWRIAFGSGSEKLDFNPPNLDIGGGASPSSSTSLGWSSSITPTPVVLLQLQALSQNGKVTVRWSTSSEMKTAGFDLYRLTDGQWVKINDVLIPSQGWPNGGIGANYSVLDPTAKPGETYSYKLVERTTDGQSIEYGPYERTVSPFLMKTFEMTPQGFKLKWLSRTGEQYRVLKRTNLASGQYEPIAENVAATPPENEYVDPVTTGAAFYRIELQQP